MIKKKEAAGGAAFTGKLVQVHTSSSLASSTRVHVAETSPATAGAVCVDCRASLSRCCYHCTLNAHVVRN
jgi:hypothetical protein